MLDSDRGNNRRCRPNIDLGSTWSNERGVDRGTEVLIKAMTSLGALQDRPISSSTGDASPGHA